MQEFRFTTLSQDAGMQISGCRNDSALHGVGVGEWDTHSSALSLETQQSEATHGLGESQCLEGGQEAKEGRVLGSLRSGGSRDTRGNDPLKEREEEQLERQKELEGAASQRGAFVKLGQTRIEPQEGPRQLWLDVRLPGLPK
jgi:hypothetical protein